MNSARHIKKLNEYINTGGYTIYFQDEVHFYRSTTIRSMWSKKGRQPRIPSAPTQENIKLSGFVNPETGELSLYECSTFNYRTTLECFRALMSVQPKDKKILIILDNASWHKKAVRLSAEDPLYKNVQFLFLPPYSPDYNPIERVWRLVRYERTHNRFFDGIDVMREVLYDYFRQYMRPNRKFQSLCSNYK